MADPTASETDTGRRVVLITGAAGGGIGTAALKFARNGYRVVITDIVDLESTKRSFEGLGAECLAITMDVTDSKSVNEAVENVLQQWSRIDVLVNNAARSNGSDILKLTEDEWDSNIALILKSVYLVSRAVLPSMINRQSGVIINIGSVNGQSGIGEEAYSAGKAGVGNLTRNLAVRYGANGVRCVCVAPGTIETDAWTERLSKNPKTLENLKKVYPLGRIGKPEDVANAVAFLASDEASWITGTTLNVDGGMMAGSAALQKDLLGE